MPSYVRGIQDEGPKYPPDCPSPESMPVCACFETLPNQAKGGSSFRISTPQQSQAAVCAPGSWPILGWPNYVTVESESSCALLWTLHLEDSLDSFPFIFNLNCWTGTLRVDQSSSFLPFFSASIITGAEWSWHGPGCQKLNEGPWPLVHISPTFQSLN